MKRLIVLLMLLSVLFSGCISENPEDDFLLNAVKGFFYSAIEQAGSEIQNSYCEFYSDEGDFTKMWAKGDKVKMHMVPSDSDSMYIIVRGNENWGWDPQTLEGTHTKYEYDLKDMPMVAMMKVTAIDAVKNNRGNCTDNIVTDSDFILPVGVQWEEGESDKDMFKDIMNEESWE